MDANPHTGEFPGSLDSPFRHIKDGIEHRSHTQGARSSTAFGGGDQIFDPLPFLVGQVAWIDFFVHLPIVPTCEDFSDRLLEAGCDDYHAKPVEFPRLLEQIEALLKRV